MNVNCELNELLAVEARQRDGSWEKNFFKALSQAKFALMGEVPRTGPDGWPYLLVDTRENPIEPAERVFEWLAQKGVGLVVNPAGDTPDYVFTYGMILNYKMRGEFLSALDSTESGRIEIPAGTAVHAGPPNDDYLPPFSRQILRDFFKENGVENVRILVMSPDRKRYDLYFSSESLGSPRQEEHQGILEAVSWFLPPHYSLMIASEAGLPPFYEL